MSLVWQFYHACKQSRPFTRMGILASVTLGICTLLLGFTLALLSGSHLVETRLRDATRIAVYLSEETDGALANIIARKVQALEHVSSVTHVAPEKALEQFKRMGSPMADLVDGVDPTWMPHTLDVSPQASATWEDIQHIANEIQKISGVEMVDTGLPDHMHIIASIHAARMTGFIITSIVFGATALLMAIIMRLTMLSRTKELQILRMIGASRFYITMPFIAAGCVWGFSGSCLGIILLWLFRHIDTHIAHQWIGPLWGDFPFDILAQGHAPILIALGVSIGFLGSASVLRMRENQT